MVKKVAWVLGWCLWIVFCYYASQFVAVRTFSLFGLRGSGNTLINTLLTALIYLLMLGLSYGGAYLARKNIDLPDTKELTGLTRDIKWKDFSEAIVYVLLYFCVLVMAMVAFQLLSPTLANESQDVGFSTVNNNLLELTLIFLSLVIIAPVAEELVMRGLLFKQLRSKIPFWATSLIVSLLFAIAHGQINVAIDTFILSLFLCYTREKTGAIYSPIIMHMMKNLIGFLALYVL